MGKQTNGTHSKANASSKQQGKKNTEKTKVTETKKVEEVKTEEIKTEEIKIAAEQKEEGKAAAEQKEEGKEAAEQKEEGKTAATEKSKKAYGLVLIKEDSKNGITQRLIDPKRFQTICLIGGILLLIIVTGGIISLVRMVKLSDSVDDLSQQVSLMQNENITMQTEKAELEEKVTLLSTQVAIQLVEEEEQAEKSIPSGLPVSGKVAVISGDGNQNTEETQDADNLYCIVFGVQNGSSVMSAGTGTVIFVGPDEDYGNKIQIDHGNGYISVYRYKGDPKVKEGDEVLRGTLLYEVKSNNGKMAYQIIFEENYIDPMEIMEISG